MNFVQIFYTRVVLQLWLTRSPPEGNHFPGEPEPKKNHLLDPKPGKNDLSEPDLISKILAKARAEARLKLIPEPKSSWRAPVLGPVPSPCLQVMKKVVLNFV